MRARRRLEESANSGISSVSSEETEIETETDEPALELLSLSPTISPSLLIGVPE
jgi:hypothetical protein